MSGQKEIHFSKLVQETQDQLFRFCVLLGNNREQAEDLCQEVYLKAHGKLADLRDSAALKSWLMTIARNLFLDSKKVKSVTHVQAVEDIESLGLTNESDQELILNVRRALSHFETEDRFLILLVDLEGHSYAEAAAIFKTSEDAIRSRLHRLRKEFESTFKNFETK